MNQALIMFAATTSEFTELTSSSRTTEYFAVSGNDMNHSVPHNRRLEEGSDVLMHLFRGRVPSKDKPSTVSKRV